jgi:hypothetical protein
MALFGWAYQHGLSAVEQYFSLIAKQPQPAYKPQKQPAEQGEYRFERVLYCYPSTQKWYILLVLYYLCS